MMQVGGELLTVLVSALGKSLQGQGLPLTTTRSLYPSFFKQHFSQEVNLKHQITADLQTASKKIISPILSPSLLSPHYAQDFFAYPISFGLPKLLHPFKLSSEQRSFTHSHALAVSGSVRGDSRLVKGPRPGTGHPRGPSH